jgi:uncharacterized protein YbjT (DUF2867 family)
MQHLRQEILNQVRSPNLKTKYGFDVAIIDSLASECDLDPSGDMLDALLATIQATSASRKPNYGIPENCDRLEGWICQ